MGACSNRRGVQRYSIRAPLRWEGVEGRDCGEGLTENISTRGVYFLGDRPMAVGQPIRLTMTLERRSVSVGGSGVVVRVEPRPSGYGVGVWPQQVFDRAAQRLPLDPASTRVHLPEALHEEPRRHLLEQDAVDAEPKRLERLAVVDRLGNENDAGRQARLQNIARDFEPALARQPDVQDDDIGRVRTHGRQRLWAVGRGGHNGEILDRTEEALEAQADDLVTLRNDEPDGLPGHELAVARRPRAERSRRRAPDGAHRRFTLCHVLAPGMTAPPVPHFRAAGAWAFVHSHVSSEPRFPDGLTLFRDLRKPVSDRISFHILMNC